jgi:hypothetical protein
MFSRRRFLKTAALIVASAPLVRIGLCLRRKGKSISFTVAGSRYFPHLPALRSGERVYLVKGLFNEEVCYRVTTFGGETIGYVPKRNVAEIGEYHNCRWILLVDPLVKTIIH